MNLEADSPASTSQTSALISDVATIADTQDYGKMWDVDNRQGLKQPTNEVAGDLVKRNIVLDRLTVTEGLAGRKLLYTV